MSLIPSFVTGAVRRAVRAVPVVPSLVAVLVLPILAPPAAGQVDGISYTLTPVYDLVRWDDDLGLEDTELLGGRLSYNLGRYVSLQGYYLGRNNVETVLGSTALRDARGFPLPDQRVDLLNYGGDLVLNLGTGGVTPFLRGGGGILRFTPDEGDVVKVINVKAGAGFRLGVDRFQVEVFAEDSAFRLDRTRLAAPGAVGAEDLERDELRHSLSLGAGVNFLLGGRGGSATVSETDAAFSRTFEGGLGGLSIPVEPFVGRLNYNEKLGLEDQELLGVRSGLDFGRYLGVRGYYWRGVSSNFDETVPVQSWGGEARFNLGAGQGAVPYLVGGVGQLDFLEDFRDGSGEPRTDRTMLIAGGGMTFAVGDRFRVDLSARNHIFSDDDLEDVASPDDLYSNWMLGGAISFNFFGSAPDGRRGFLETRRARETGTVPPASPAAPAPAETAPGAVADAAPMTPTAGETSPPSGDTSVQAPVPAAAGDTTAAPVVVTPPPAAGAPAAPVEGTLRSYHGDRVVTIPVPTEGEIYIRYGRPGAVDIESRNLSQEGTPLPGAGTATPSTEARAGSGIPATPAAPTEADLRQIIRDELSRSGLLAAAPRLSDEELLDRLEARQAERAAATEAVRPAETEDESPSGDEDSREPEATGDRPGVGLGLHGVRVYTGYGVDSPNQFVLGGRLNIGPATRTSRFDLVPEVAFGTGDDVNTLLVAMNFMLKLRDHQEEGKLNPYVMAGVGFLRVSPDGGDSETDAVVNFSGGLSRDFGRMTLFTEYQGIDAFDTSRILLGVRLNR